MVSFEIFVKAMPPSLSELKVLSSFCFAFKIPDDRAVTNIYQPGSSVMVVNSIASVVVFNSLVGISVVGISVVGISE